MNFSLRVCGAGTPDCGKLWLLRLMKNDRANDLLSSLLAREKLE